MLLANKKSIFKWSQKKQKAGTGTGTGTGTLCYRAFVFFYRGPPMDGPSCMVLNDARPPPLWGGPGGLGAGLQEKVVKFLRKY